MTNPNDPAAPTEAEVAQGLIAREQADLRAGLAVMSGVFLIATLLIATLSFLVIDHFRPAALPAGVVGGLLVIGLIFRFLRLRRAAGRANKLWQAGKLNTGEDAHEAAKRYLAGKKS